MYKVSTKVPGRYARTVKNDIKSKEDAMTCAMGAITAYGHELAARKMLKGEPNEGTVIYSEGDVMYLRSQDGKTEYLRAEITRSNAGVTTEYRREYD